MYSRLVLYKWAFECSVGIFPLEWAAELFDPVRLIRCIRHGVYRAASQFPANKWIFLDEVIVYRTMPIPKVLAKLMSPSFILVVFGVQVFHVTITTPTKS